MPRAKKPDDLEIPIIEIKTGHCMFGVIGTTPLLYNSMSAKAKQTLLLGGTKKTAAEKAVNIKHDPLQEFRDSIYRLASGPTLLAARSSWFKAAMCNAALDLPGTRKTEIGRAVWVEGDLIPLYGIPKLSMGVVRSADINHTPDIRTRAIVGEWCVIVEIHFMIPKLTPVAIGRLLGAGGLLAGVGDFRQQKGKGNNGQFRVVDVDDPELARIMKISRKVQQEAMDRPQCWDEETEELLAWYNTEILHRGRRDQIASFVEKEDKPEPRRRGRPRKIDSIADSIESRYS